MKKIISILLLVPLSLPLSALGAHSKPLDIKSSDNIELAYSNGAYRLKRKITRLNRAIYLNERKINRIEHSKDLSYNEKKRQIGRLKREIYYDKKELRRIKLQYRRALS